MEKESPRPRPTMLRPTPYNRSKVWPPPPMKVLVADALSDAGLAVLHNKKLVADIKTGQTEDQLVQLIPDYDALVVRSATKVTRRILEAGTRLRVVGRAGVGV